MKIAVVGCGAVGSFYGAKLARAGHEVHFLLRSDFETVRLNGVLIRSPQEEFRVHPHCARSPEEIGPSELVLIGLKTTANAQFGRLVPPLVAGHTAVLTLQNGLGNEEALARVLPAQQLLGGLCFVCLNRLEPGVIRHLDYGQIILGEFQGPPQQRTHQLAQSFGLAQVSCKVSPNLARAHWEKLTWNIPFNGLGVAAVAGYQAVLSGQLPQALTANSRAEPPQSCLTTQQLLADSNWTQLAGDLILEVCAAARALGFDLSDALVEQQLSRTRSMGPYKASTLLDFERALPLELESLFLEPLRQAQAAGVAMPRLEALCRLLVQLDAARETRAG